MILKQKSLEKLRELINKETEYRSGPKLVEFFNDLGSNDEYGRGSGFPSRWLYTDQKLQEINGTPELDRCIKKVLDPINFIENIEVLDNIIEELNKYLAFDKWKIIRNHDEIDFEKTGKVIIKPSKSMVSDEGEFLTREFEEVSVDALQLEAAVTGVLKKRIEEIRICLASDAPLSAIFLCGSTLEGVLLGVATKHPRDFNQSKSAPKSKDGRVKSFQDWNLNNFIDTAHSIGFIREDVKKYSHSLRGFRNYIHPYQQLTTGFDPDIHTARLSWQVLKLTLSQLSLRKA
tara:strand:- start:55 stop:921 length:867 start_codon:yes stop_codon:yes gene_type:complete